MLKSICKDQWNLKVWIGSKFRQTTIQSDAVAVTGCDPEYEGEYNSLKEVVWMSLDEISEKDRAFLWSYGLMQVDGFFKIIKGWDNETSYPGT